MRKVLLFTSILLLVALFSTQAQERTVSGQIIDNNSDPVPAATIQVAGTTTGTTADATGHFSLTAKEGDQLVVTSLGYEKKNVTVPSGNESLTITLQSNAHQLSETVVTAFGIEHDNAKLGYSISKVDGEDITRTNSVNPIAALQGKIAGVHVNLSGANGVQASPYMQIRGASVLGGNNQPIFVIDGNVLQNNISGPDDADYGSQLKNLNPDDYKSITVLKGPAATALYGSRGINGAVVIETKKGKAGQGLGVEFTSTYQITHAYKPFMDLQNEYGQGSINREGHFKDDGSQDRVLTNWGPKFDGSMHPAVYDPDNTKAPYEARPDNWNTFFKDGHYANNNIALSGGGEHSNFRIGYSNTHDIGTLPNNKLKR